MNSALKFFLKLGIVDRGVLIFCLEMLLGYKRPLAPVLPLKNVFCF